MFMAFVFAGMALLMIWFVIWKTFISDKDS